VNNNKDYAAGFSWRPTDRGGKRGDWKRDLVISLVLAIGAGLMGMVAAARAEPQLVQISGKMHTAMLTVTMGKSQDVHTDRSFVDVTVGDPDVADVNPLTDHSISILAKKIGTTRVSVYAEDKKLVGIFDVEVNYDVTRLTNELRRRFPGSTMQVSSVNGRIMLAGEAPDAVSVDQAVGIARQFGPDVINA
jgi:pilus assembly protein CpaC